MLAHPANIVRIVAAGNKRWLFFTDREPYKSYKSLAYMIDLLPAGSFLKSHGSYIIHLKHARYFWFAGQSIEVLLSGDQLGRVSKENFGRFDRARRNFTELLQIVSEDDIPVM